MPVHFLDRVHRPASGSVAVGVVLEVSLEDGSTLSTWNEARAFSFLGFDFRYLPKARLFWRP
jgi:hypothetical protein